MAWVRDSISDPSVSCVEMSLVSQLALSATSSVIMIIFSAEDHRPNRNYVYGRYTYFSNLVVFKLKCLFILLVCVLSSYEHNSFY